MRSKTRIPRKLKKKYKKMGIWKRYLNLRPFWEAGSGTETNRVIIADLSNEQQTATYRIYNGRE